MPDDPVYYVASCECWIPKVGSKTISVCWPRGESLEAVTGRFVSEIKTRFKVVQIPTSSHVSYIPPLARIKAVTNKTLGVF